LNHGDNAGVGATATLYPNKRGVRNRASTLVNWSWSYITFRSAIRPIAGGD
jgi:hypothetical protein